MSGSPRSTETELCRAASAAWGPRPATASTAQPKMRLVSWEPFVKSSLRGFAVIELPNGLLIHDVPLLYSHSKAWTALPAKPPIDGDGGHKRDASGKPTYTKIPEWRNRELSNRFSEALVALLCSTHSDALGRDGR